METGTLTKTEEAHVERMSGSFKEPTMSERFNEWAARSISEAKQEKKKDEGRSRSREINLEGRSDEEKEFFAGAGEKEKDESEKKPPAKSSADKEAVRRSEEHPNAKESKAPDPKAGEKAAASGSDDSPSEPLSGDLVERHWQGKLQGPEIEKHISQVNSRAGIILKHIDQHPDKDAITQGFRALMAGRHQGADQPGFFRDLSVALAECSSPGEVFHHITMQPQDREAIRGCKNAKELRAAIRTIAKHYPGSASQASPKPRAPKPPSEIAGRGSAGDDAPNGFSDFSERMHQRYAEAR